MQTGASLTMGPTCGSARERVSAQLGLGRMAPGPTSPLDSGPCKPPASRSSGPPCARQALRAPAPGAPHRNEDPEHCVAEGSTLSRVRNEREGHGGEGVQRAEEQRQRQGHLGMSQVGRRHERCPSPAVLVRHRTSATKPLATPTQRKFGTLVCEWVKF